MKKIINRCDDDEDDSITNYDAAKAHVNTKQHSFRLNLIAFHAFYRRRFIQRYKKNSSGKLNKKTSRFKKTIDSQLDLLAERLEHLIKISKRRCLDEFIQIFCLAREKVRKCDLHKFSLQLRLTQL